MEENDLIDSLLGKPKISQTQKVFFSFLCGTLSYTQALHNYTILPYKTRMDSLYN